MDYEVEYDNRARVPEHPEILAGWRQRSLQLRGTAVAADFGIPYGPTQRQILDIVWPDTTRLSPVVLYFHGGYWQMSHPRDITFVAEGCLAHGVAVAFAGYDLAPDVPLDTIVAQARGAVVCLHHRIKRRLVVAGHSAGAHLAAALTATRWQQVDPRGPDDVVPAGLGISGPYDLEPLVSTRINEALKLSAAEARRLSPVAWEPPAGRTFSAFVGAAESGEFLRQAKDMAETWGRRGVAADAVVVPGTNHFTVVDEMADPASPMVRRLVALARAGAVFPAAPELAGR